eukprot:TRINITY_DN8493_c0_g1_i1.p1 TRINITY_DN8493_c0_g1~~TRINITY_DN8493_c0_g1_i1.p1  ORF type:complete len:162 (+),score=34.18 TRINITY_DN8493_c0_g1_i1:295-780(+)
MFRASPSDFASMEPKKITFLLVSAVVLEVLLLRCEVQLTKPSSLLGAHSDLLGTLQEELNSSMLLSQLSQDEGDLHSEATLQKEVDSQSNLSRSRFEFFVKDEMEQIQKKEEQSEETCSAPTEEDEQNDHLSMATLFVAGVLTQMMSKFLASEQLVWVAAA